MKSNITELLKKLQIEDSGRYDNHMYVVDLEDSAHFAQMYTHLSDVAINTEYPSFISNTNKNTIKAVNYFEIDVDNITYNIFLTADFDNDKYYIKIGEKD